MGTLISTSAKYGLEISAHGLLAHFAETGLVGAALFFWAMYVFVKWTRPQPDASKYLIATRIAMAAILVVGLFHQVLESSLFYVVYALGCGYGFRIRQDLAEISAGPRAVPDDGRGAS